MSHEVAKIPVIGKPVANVVSDVGKFVSDPGLGSLSKVGRDVLPIAETAAATALGIPLPASAALVSGGNTLAKGGSLGDVAKNAAISAGTAYAGNQLFGGGDTPVDPETGVPVTSSPSSGIFSGIGDALSSAGSGISSTLASLASSIGLSPENLSSLFSSSGGGASADSFSSVAPLADVSSSPLNPTGGGEGIFASSPVDSVGDLSALDFTDPNSLTSGATPNVGTGTVGTQGLSEGGSLNSAVASAAGAPPTTLSSFYFPGGDASSAAAGGGAASGGVASPTSSPSLWSSLKSDPFGTIGQGILNHPGIALGAGALGLDALKQQTPPKGTPQLEGIAGQQNTQGTQLEQTAQQALTTGQLPPGYSASITQASNDAKASIRSQYAARGMSGSSAEQQDLAAVDSRASAQGQQMMLQLLQTGISETGAAAGLYEQLMQGNLAQDKDLSSALASFAASLAGGGKGVTLQLPGA